jgi:hypothetical protein
MRNREDGSGSIRRQAPHDFHRACPVRCGCGRSGNTRMTPMAARFSQSGSQWEDGTMGDGESGIHAAGCFPGRVSS